MSRSKQSLPQGQILSSNPVQHIEGLLGKLDGWIGLRERLLEVLSGTGIDAVLNVAAAGFLSQSGKDPASELKRALDLIKTTSVIEGCRPIRVWPTHPSAKVEHQWRCSMSKPRRFCPGVLSKEEKKTLQPNL